MTTCPVVLLRCGRWCREMVGSTKDRRRGRRKVASAYKRKKDCHSSISLLVGVLLALVLIFVSAFLSRVISVVLIIRDPQHRSQYFHLVRPHTLDTPDIDKDKSPSPSIGVTVCECV